MNPKVVKNIFFPLHEFLMGRSTVRFLSTLERSQWLLPDELKQLQWNKLKVLINHAYENVSYYRSSFKSLDLHPQDIKSEEDFTNIPILTKDLIKNNLPSLVSNDSLPKLIRYSTGGSTGDPVVFYTDKNKEAAHNAAKLRARRWWDINIGDPQIDLWGSPIELSKQDRMRVLKDRIFLNSILLSAFNLTESSVKQYLEIMRSFRPVILYGYPSVLYQVAIFCEDYRIDHGLNRLKAIVATSEMLHEHQRKKIREVFQAPVINEYGCRDGGYIAQECPAGNMHIAMEHVYVEFIPLSRPGGEMFKEVVITNLDGYRMPFIRYRLGDLASGKDGRCSCGRGLALLKSIEGRDNDMLVSPEGKVIHGLSIMYILRDIQGIKKYKVTQEAIDRIVIELIRNSQYQVSCEKGIREKIGKLMGQSVRIDISYRNVINAETSGKYRWIISKVIGKHEDPISSSNTSR